MIALNRSEKENWLNACRRR